MPDAAADLFTCPRHLGELRISAITCASMWTRARRVPEDALIRLAPCVGCPIGAAHAGAPVSARSATCGSGPTCVRCGRGGRRLIYKLLCVSCYNRQKEYVRGRNARGGPVRHHKPLFCVIAGIVGDAGDVRPLRVDWTSGWVEALMVTSRSTGATRFGRVSTTWRDAAPCPVVKRQSIAFNFGA